jgi:hypothetical protein
MDQGTQQNAALVEQAAAASQAMLDQATRLAEVASIFKLDGWEQPARPKLAAVPSTATELARLDGRPGRGAAAARRLQGRASNAQAVAEDWE